jgi:threonine dehydratase
MPTGPMSPKDESMHDEPLVTLADVEAAALRIADRVHRTPVLTSRMLDAHADRRLFFKSEHLQRTGSFKVRGAVNRLLTLSDEALARGVITDSSGNFGQALAWAGAELGVAVTVVMPSDSAVVKRTAIRGYGSEVVLAEPGLRPRKDMVRKLLKEHGATYVSSNDDLAIIAGQGTAGLELMDQVPDLDAVVTPVGGGGMLAGVAVAVRGRRPTMAVFAAEPRGADDTARSLAAGTHLPPGAHDSVAKGLLVGMGALPWRHIHALVEQAIVVEDPDTVSAMRLLFERMKQVVEPSAAIALAAALKLPPAFQRVGVVLSGGNVDLDALPWT